MISLREQLIQDEGLRLKPYKDTVGKTTIGVGRNIDAIGISKDEAMYLLANDIKRADIACHKIFPNFDKFSQSRREALTNMAFNLGETRLRGFTKMVSAVNRGDWEQAASDAHHSKWFEQVGQRARRIITAFGVEA